ncbi:4Fe-4S binding protein [Ruminiclostridium josui]|uniref:4Fe-4S binding protein n=1 Tax=Ruminiclostridium josui TaxID=1499 RepID=UPI00046776D6|nr:4Fe-4S binding protein [Ruminiclostridium josui]
MGQVNYKELKNGGFIQQVQKDNFSMRLGIAGGHIKADQLLKVYEIAKKYGQGYIHMTSRQSIEIPYIKLEDIETVKRELAEAELYPAASGPRVRTITACQGNSVCKNGLIDSADLAKEFSERYYGKELPHKFKLGITACTNNCLKAEENDLGVKGAIKPVWSKNNCTYCGLCEAVCRHKAITIDKEVKGFSYDESLCKYCGKCVKGCPKGAYEGESGFIVYFGGLFGNRIAIGKQLLPIVFPKDKLFDIIDVTLGFFEKNAKKGERFRYTLDRVGWELFEKELEGVL